MRAIMTIAVVYGCPDFDDNDNDVNKTLPFA